MIITAEGPKSNPAGQSRGRASRHAQDVASAKDAWQQANDSAHPDAAPRAAYNLGYLLEKQGDVAGAKDAWQQAIDSGHADMAPQAAPHLRVLRTGKGTHRARRRR